MFGLTQKEWVLSFSVVFSQSKYFIQCQKYAIITKPKFVIILTENHTNGGELGEET